jgi:cobalt-zinc-cadmium efflux system membrane fusion protein
MTETPPPGRSRQKGLPRSVQTMLVVALAIAAAAAFYLEPRVAAWLVVKPVAEASAPATPAGTFRPTDEQWQGIKVETVPDRVFHAEEATDGKIAIDDDRATPVFSPYSGRVTRLIAKPGERVDVGTPLFAVQASEVVQGQNDLITAIAGLAKAHAQLALTQTAEKRQHDLYEAKAGALKDWQQAQADLTAARNDVRSGEIAVAAVRNRLRILGKSDHEIEAFEASGKMDADAIVRSPIAGTVILRKVGQGQYIQSGASDPVFSIGDLATVWLIANVREADAGLVHVGDPVQVRVLAYPNRTYDAHIVYVASAVDPNTRRLPVRAEVANADGSLKPEMFARFSIITGADRTAPAVPQSAIVYEGESARVWVVNADKTVGSRAIRVGRVSDGAVEVVDGLKSGDKVVTGGTLFIDRAASGD